MENLPIFGLKLDPVTRKQLEVLAIYQDRSKAGVVRTLIKGEYQKLPKEEIAVIQATVLDANIQSESDGN